MIQQRSDSDHIALEYGSMGAIHRYSPLFTDIGICGLGAFLGGKGRSGQRHRRHDIFNHACLVDNDGIVLIMLPPRSAPSRLPPTTTTRSASFSETCLADMDFSANTQHLGFWGYFWVWVYTQLVVITDALKSDRIILL